MTNPCNSHELQGFFVGVIPPCDGVSRNTRSCHFALRRGIQKYRQRLVPASDTLLDPASSAGYVHSSQQREERTKKRRRCYRALSVVGWRRPRGLRNSLRSDSPRPRSSVGWPLPGPIKAESIATMQRLGHTARGGESMSYRAPGIPVHVLPRCDAVSRSCRAVDCQNVHVGNRTRWRRRRKYGMKMGAERYRDTDSGAYRPPGWRVVQFL